MRNNKLKWLLTTLCTLLLCSLFTLPVLAEDDYQLVYDPTYVLNDDQFYELNDIAKDISLQYECAVHFVITDDPAIDENNIQVYSEDLYLYNDAFGYGYEKDGFMLVVNIETRC